MNNDYIDFKIEDFLDNPTFCEWVRNPSFEQDKLWNNWILEHPNKKADIQAAKVLLSCLKYKKLNSIDSKKEIIWSKIETEINEKSKKSQLVFKPKLFPWIVSLAASFLLIFYFYNFDSKKQLNLVNGEVLTHILPDNSVIDINAKSKVNYKKGSYNQSRIVNLFGEAFFNVNKGSSFEVITPFGSIKVLGTSFNVYARDSILEVECFTGKVSVKYTENNKEFILLPGDKISIYHEDIKITQKKDNIQNIWKNGYFYYEDTKLKRVLSELVRQFDIKYIKISWELESKKYTGFFTKVDLEHALKSICEPLQLKYKIVNDTLIIE